MAEYIWECKECGLKVKLPHPKNVYHKCPKSSDPTLIDKVKNYVTAVTRWTMAGRPMRTDEKVKEILEKHCQKCNYEKDGVCSHKRCGCRINTEKIALLNKIKMATEHCPIRKW